MRQKLLFTETTLDSLKERKTYDFINFEVFFFTWGQSAYHWALCPTPKGALPHTWGKAPIFVFFF